jgi:hypothetical protein
MANFALVENDTITGIYDDLPQNWGRVSNLYLLSNETDHLKTLGWYKIRRQDPEYDPNVKMPGKLSYIFTGTEVIETNEILDRPPEPPAKTAEQLAAEEQARIENQWSVVRRQRDQLMRDNDWRYLRYQRQQRTGTATADDLAKVDAYMQALADITSQVDPYNIIWPTLE